MLEIYQAHNGTWIVNVNDTATTFSTEAEARTFFAEQEKEARIMAREDEFISEARRAARTIWDGINVLKALQREHTALDYTTTLTEGTGANAGITPAEVTAVVFDTANALEATLASGHGTNLAKLL